MIYKAISVRQPWAEYIIGHGKDVENRTWETDYRGPLLIHAGKAWGPGCGPHWDPYDTTRLIVRGRCGAPDLPPEAFVRSAIIGQVDMVDCTFGYPSKWAELYSCHWVFANPRRWADPVPWKGRLGLFDVELP